jgi:hypothetical protein
VKIAALRSFLESWPYDAKNNVRVACGADGREIILVRQPMGLEEYEIDGRPDGRRIHGMESAFDFHGARLDAAKQSNALIGFDLSAKDCAELFDESVLYHNRLLLFFRLKDWTRVERDAAHSLRLIEFIKQHAQCEEDRVQLDQWHPDIARIDAVARAMILSEKGQYRDALRIARDIIGNFEAVADDGPDHEKLADALLESVRESLANRPTLRTDEESLFLRRNDYWIIRYHGHTALLKSTRGVHYLAVLFRDPGREFHVKELLARPMDVSTQTAAVVANGRVTGGLYAGVPVLDAQAKAEYKCRLKDLRQDLNQAERFNDLQRKTEVQNELQAIADYIASAVGLGGQGPQGFLGRGTSAFCCDKMY